MTTSMPPQQRTTHWRERALSRAEAITDAWEVTKAYAGRIADWILFGCMVMNIIEILPEVSLPPAVSNLVLGVQVVMLDIGGFSLTSMGEYAREQGDERAARRASVTGGLLIAIMIVTLLLVSIGLLWPTARVYTDMAEKGLILVRVFMTVIYGHVIHSLRRSVQTHTVHIPLADVSARLDAYSEHLRQVQAEMHQHAREVESSISSLVHAVVQTQTHAIVAELQTVQAQMDRAVQSQFIEVYALVQSLTTLHTSEPVYEPEREHDEASERVRSEQTRKGTRRQTNPSLALVHSITDEPLSEQSGEPLEHRIKQFILAQREQGHEPSLAEIMDRCACSKGSAIRYRRELNDERSASDERRVVGE